MRRYCGKQHGQEHVYEHCVGGRITRTSKEEGTHVPLQIGGNYYPDMDHLELIDMT